MKKPLSCVPALLVLALFLVGCTAEGELEDVDMGVGGNSSFDAGSTNVLPNGTTPNAMSDAGGMGSTDASNAVCDPLAPACPPGEKCVPNATTGQSTCIPTGTETPVGSVCQRTGECVEGSACVSDDGQTLCRELCDSSDVSSCSSGFCTQTLGSNPDLGVCADEPAACDIYEQNCSNGDCVLLRNPADGEIGAYCGSAGSVTDGQPCGNGAGDCRPGAICIQAGADTQPTCHAVCRDPDLPCNQGACTGTSTSSVDFCV
jgi:hypothetical protein